MIKIEIDDNKTSVFIQNHSTVDIVDNLAEAVDNILNDVSEKSHNSKSSLVQAFLYAFVTNWDLECKKCKGTEE